MSILSGIKKVIPYFKNEDGNYEQLSYKTSSQTVDFDDGNTAETKLGAIDGITKSLNSTSDSVAISASAGKSLQDQITTLNSNIGYLNVLNLSHPKGGRVRLVIKENNTGDSMAFGALLISYSGCALASFGAKTAGKQPDKIESLCGTLYRENYINLDDGNRTLTVVCPFGVKFELI